jgi:hypothetical protein
MSDKPAAIDEALKKIAAGETPALKKVDAPKTDVSDAIKQAYLEDQKEKGK